MARNNKPAADETPIFDPGAENEPDAAPAFDLTNERRNGKPENTADTDKLDDLLESEDVSGGQVRIHRRGPHETRYAYIVTVPVEEFSMDWVRNVHGGGSYIFKLYRRDRKLYKEFNFEIDPRLKGSVDAAPIQQAPVIANTGNQDNTALLVQIMNQSAESQRSSMALMITMMMKSQETMATVMAAALGGKASSQREEPVSALLAAATGMITKAQQPAPVQDPAEAIARSLHLLRELKSLSAGGSDDGETKETTGDKILSMVATTLPAALSAFAASRQPQGMQPRTVNPQPPHAIPAQAPRTVQPAPVQAVPVQEATPLPPDDGSAEAYIARLSDQGKTLLAQVRHYAPLLKLAAENNTPVESYLDILNDVIDDHAAAQLDQIMSRTDWKLILFGDPNPQPAEWFDNLREMYLHPEEAEPETVTFPGPVPTS